MENVNDVFAMLRLEEASTTENGADGFRTTGHALLDLSYLIPDFRRGEYHIDLFHRALKEDPEYTLRWLLYLRDIRGGCGERNAFRILLTELCDRYPKAGLEFLDSIPLEEYGRWDDWLYIFSHSDNKAIKDLIGFFLKMCFESDIAKACVGEPVSLLAKWLPSESSKNLETKYLAKELRKDYFVMSSKVYRKSLSKLRALCAPTEVKISAREWDKVDYSAVPSVANTKYSNAFLRHDTIRRDEYLKGVKAGKKKINANAAFLHDIVKMYGNSTYPLYSGVFKDYNEAIEQMWKAQKRIEGLQNTLVVRDGSGSMQTPVGSGHTLAIDIADAISIYCSEQNTGVWHNKILTFSSKPQTIELQDYMSLRDKLIALHKHDDYTNTDIEKTFRLMLDVAVRYHLKQEEIPNMLIISDMEFNAATTIYSNEYWDRTKKVADKKLFDSIAEQFAAKGYKLPKLIFWNVNSRTNTIPARENDLGVTLISGFSKASLNMAITDKNDPYEALTEILDSDRYDVITQEMTDILKASVYYS